MPLEIENRGLESSWIVCHPVACMHLNLCSMPKRVSAGGAKERKDRVTSSKDRGLCQYLLAECEKSANKDLSFLKRLCKAKRAEYVLRQQRVTATATAAAAAESYGAVAPAIPHVRLKWPLLQLRQLLRLEMHRVTVLRRQCAKPGLVAWCLIWFRSPYSCLHLSPSGSGSIGGCAKRRARANS